MYLPFSGLLRYARNDGVEMDVIASEAKQSSVEVMQMLLRSLVANI